MGIDDYLRQERKLAEALGLRTSAVEQALKLTRPLGTELGILREKALLGQAIAAPRSVADEIARGQKMLLGDTISRIKRDHLGVGAITDFLRGGTPSAPRRSSGTSAQPARRARPSSSSASWTEPASASPIWSGRAALSEVPLGRRCQT